MTQVAALIGDLVGSRKQSDRAAVHRALAGAIDAVNDETDPVTPLRITVGDEYQGCFARVGEALAAALRMRLLLAPVVDVRHGIGWGSVKVLSQQPRVEDGSAWWAARDAIEEAEKLAARAGSRSVRTVFRLPEGASREAPYDEPLVAAVNAALLLRDEAVAGLGTSGVAVLTGLLEGRTQKSLAADLRISTSAVSQRYRRGIATILHAGDLLSSV